LAKDLVPDGEVQLNFGVITKAKSPAVQTLPVLPDARRTGHMIGAMKQIWSAIKSGITYPNPSPINCSGCPFKSKCGAWGMKGLE